MLFKKTIWWVMVLVLNLGFNTVVWGRASNDVTIRVAEIGRYHVENQSMLRNGSDLIQIVDVAIFSNSSRKWRFVAIPYSNSAGLEWSIDNRAWHSFRTQMGVTMLTGAKSDWRNYRFYIKVRGVSEGTVNLGYQLLFSE
jgi:hypothetical protein